MLFIALSGKFFQYKLPNLFHVFKQFKSNSVQQMVFTIRLLNGDMFQVEAVQDSIAKTIYKEYTSLYPDPPIFFEQLSFSSESKGVLPPYTLSNEDSELFLMIRPLYSISYMGLLSTIELCEKALPSFKEWSRNQPNLRLLTWADPSIRPDIFYVTQIVSTSHLPGDLLSDGKSIALTYCTKIDRLPIESTPEIGVTPIYLKRLEWIQSKGRKVKE